MEPSFWQQEAQGTEFDPDGEYMRRRERQLAEETRRRLAGGPLVDQELPPPPAATEPQYDPNHPDADWSGLVAAPRRRKLLRGRARETVRSLRCRPDRCLRRARLVRLRDPPQSILPGMVPESSADEKMQHSRKHFERDYRFRSAEPVRGCGVDAEGRPLTRARGRRARSPRRSAPPRTNRDQALRTPRGRGARAGCPVHRSSPSPPAPLMRSTRCLANTGPHRPKCLESRRWRRRRRTATSSGGTSKHLCADAPPCRALQARRSLTPRPLYFCRSSRRGGGRAPACGPRERRRGRPPLRPHPQPLTLWAPAARGQPPCWRASAPTLRARASLTPSTSAWTPGSGPLHTPPPLWRHRVTGFAPAERSCVWGKGEWEEARAQGPWATLLTPLRAPQGHRPGSAAEAAAAKPTFPGLASPPHRDRR